MVCGGAITTNVFYAKFRDFVKLLREIVISLHMQRLVASFACFRVKIESLAFFKALGLGKTF